jgi:hypothetical protein
MLMGWRLELCNHHGHFHYDTVWIMSRWEGEGNQGHENADSPQAVPGGQEHVLVASMVLLNKAPAFYFLQLHHGQFPSRAFYDSRPIRSLHTQICVKGTNSKQKGGGEARAATLPMIHCKKSAAT